MDAAEDVVAVVVDLKGSTKLDYKGKHANTSARLYEATTGPSPAGEGARPAVRGHPGRRISCACPRRPRLRARPLHGITLKTFSEEDLVPTITARMGERFPKTGLKVGLAASRLVVKRVGTRSSNEPIWAGKAVNWATKCAQHADANELIATEKVFKHFGGEGPRAARDAHLVRQADRVDPRALLAETREELVRADQKAALLLSAMRSLPG